MKGYSALAWTILCSLSCQTQQARACGVAGVDEVSLKKVEARFSRKLRKLSSNDPAPFAADHKNPSWESRLGNLLLAKAPGGESAIVLSLPTRIAQSTYRPFPKN